MLAHLIYYEFAVAVTSIPSMHVMLPLFSQLDACKISDCVFGCLGEYSKTCIEWPLSKRPINGFQDRLSLNAGQKYCRMLPLEHSAILSTFIKLKLPVVIKIFVL